MNSKKSQTATEYLIILAVVIVIALIVVGVLGGIPSIGGGISKSTHLAQLGSKDVGVSNYAFQAGHAKIKIKNNQPNSIKVNSLWVDQIPCGSYDPMFPFQLKVGESKTITCWNMNSEMEYFNDLVFEYIDLETGGVYNTADGKSVEEFKGISLTDCYGEGADPDGPYYICTCDDLNEIRNNLTEDFELLYNIDFMDSSCGEYRDGSGWVPLGNNSVKFAGDFNGAKKTINGLRINRPNEDYIGLFGYSTGAITSTRLANSFVVGHTYVGSLMGVKNNPDKVYNSMSIGKVQGNSYIGGLIGSYIPGILTNVSFIGTVRGVSYVGGLAGYFSAGTAINSFTISAVTGDSNVASLVGGGPFFPSDSFWYNSTSNPDYCYNFMGSPSNTGCGLCIQSDCSDRYADLGWSPFD